MRSSVGVGIGRDFIAQFCRKLMLASVLLAMLPITVNAASIPVADPYAAWQGVAKVGKNYYLSTDRDENFNLHNYISVYDSAANLVTRKSYSFTDYSFGDINYFNGLLYGTLYNYNAGGRPYHSKVVLIEPTTLKILKTYNIGGSIAESVVYHKGYWWVGYHNRRLIRKFNNKFQAVQDYPMIDPFSDIARTQGMFFYGGRLYVQRHGPNTLGLEPAPGLDSYSFEQGSFIYHRSLPPLAYGTGQGVEYSNGLLVQNDRPNNSIETIPFANLLNP